MNDLDKKIESNFKEIIDFLIKSYIKNDLGDNDICFDFYDEFSSPSWLVEFSLYGYNNTVCEIVVHNSGWRNTYEFGGSLSSKIKTYGEKIPINMQKYIVINWKKIKTKFLKAVRECKKEIKKNKDEEDYIMNFKV